MIQIRKNKKAGIKKMSTLQIMQNDFKCIIVQLYIFGLVCILNVRIEILLTNAHNITFHTIENSK